MPKIQYITKNFNASSLFIIDQANDIINEMETDNLILTLRQLYYQFVSKGLIENTQRAYKRLGNIISDARLSGLIDWDSVEDRTRSKKGVTHWLNPGEIIRVASKAFHMDHWKDQEIRPEVWIEKEALIGVISTICRRLDVDYFACKGYVSQSEMWKASQRFLDNIENNQTPVIIHLGDHDPSGIDMTRDIQDRVNTFGAFDCDVRRIALTMDQIKQYKPPPNPAKFTDSRCKEYVSNYGYDSWELDALNPRILRDLIEKTVLEYRDGYIHDSVLTKENKYLKILDRVEKNWRKL